ncbi:5'-deoxynucleotidase [Natronospirillum operosum]|uniref:5'-deoxynucleotidase n=1 Tax=Natronospirillum operosum TaxID=2759953 RepID=A0A4Z0WF92_9GAMM|nr:5'-deoxynucleotidase [Natronospirillum operosum]TGG95298.1 5'-deoxynucleotidase [Natronospirillum operosum]
MKLSHFFAYLSRLRWIKRWGLKRNVVEENVMEHSWQVATIAHVLALISNRHFGGNLNAERIAVLGLYHDVSEVITGDMPTPIKYHSPTITKAYKAIEDEAEREILGMLPESLQPDFSGLLLHESIPEDQQRIVKYADMISAYLKCESELRAGNREFSSAHEQIERRIRNTGAPEVDFFMSRFVESYTLTLDDMLNSHDQEIGLKK